MSMRRSILGSGKSWSFRTVSIASSPSTIRCSSSITSPPNYREIDQRWRPRWEKSHLWTRNPPNGKQGNKYILPMFAYPSGALHLGHLRVYTISDVIARYHRMTGAEVLHPLGWDAFGLPAENAAKERGIDPSEWTLSNIQSMKEQLSSMGGCWSWDRELRTCDPSYYADTQRIFLELQRRGLAYQDEAEVNYDPVDRTVLANEQVDADGFSWRSGAKVEKIALKQWFFKITDFNDELLEGLRCLEQEGKWPPQVVSMQKNWIGKSLKAEIDFKLEFDSEVSSNVRDRFKSVTVYTTRPDTILGVQYIALSPKHPLVQALAPELEEVDLREPTAAKLLTNVRCILKSSLSNLQIPLYVAGYVDSDKGTGAVMGVPAHDDLDHTFFHERCRQAGVEPKMKAVICSSSTSATPDVSQKAFTARGVLTDACGSELSGLSSEEASEKLIRALGSDARPIESWRMRDWLISRQRYWGAPIPVIHCPFCGAVPVPEEQLPVELPQLSSEEFRRNEGNPLERAHHWLNCSCPTCGQPAKRDTDTMDTFVDSSWYFLRFTQGSATNFMPVDVYIGGVEHAILHLLYARFMTKALQGSNLLTHLLTPTSNSDDLNADNLFTSNDLIEKFKGEPFTRLLAQGMVHGRTYSDPQTGRFLKPDEVDTTDPDHVTLRKTGETAQVSFEKMSKSKYNGVEPTSFIEKYGADTTRAHMLFQAPVSEVLNWDENKIVGIQRWFGKVWSLAHILRGRLEGRLPDDRSPSNHPLKLSKTQKMLWKATQAAVESVTESYSKTFALNTVVSDLMSLTNTIYSTVHAARPADRRDLDANLDDPQDDPHDDQLQYRAYSTLLRLLTPVAPSFCEECWQVLHGTELAADFKNTASHAGFPVSDGTLPQIIDDQSQVVAVQIKGKFRFTATVSSRFHPEDVSEDEFRAKVIAAIRQSPEGSDYFKRAGLDPSTAKRVIVAKGGKLVNLVF